MQAYKIYTHPALPPQAVKQGWSWPFVRHAVGVFQKNVGFGAGADGRDVRIGGVCPTGLRRHARHKLGV